MHTRRMRRETGRSTETEIRIEMEIDNYRESKRYLLHLAHIFMGSAGPAVASLVFEHGGLAQEAEEKDIALTPKA